MLCLNHYFWYACWISWVVHMIFVAKPAYLHNRCVHGPHNIFKNKATRCQNPNASKWIWRHDNWLQLIRWLMLCLNKNFGNSDYRYNFIHLLESRATCAPRTVIWTFRCVLLPSWWVRYTSTRNWGMNKCMGSIIESLSICLYYKTSLLLFTLLYTRKWSYWMISNACNIKHVSSSTTACNLEL